jgi:hypothetical protein
VRLLSFAGTGRPATWIADVIALLLVVPAGASTPVAERSEVRIANSDVDDVWMMNADGTNRVRQTTKSDSEFDPDRSPNSSALAISAVGHIVLIPLTALPP